MLGDDLDVLSYEVGRVETDTELTGHRDVCTGAESLHKSLERPTFRKGGEKDKDIETYFKYQTWQSFQGC